MEPTEKDLSYIAGFFDGEGSISIRKARPTKSTQSIRYSLLVTITNTNLPVLESIQSLIGGVIHDRAWRTLMQRQSYNLYWSASQGRKVLETLIPYLKVKRQEAELGIAFQNVVGIAGENHNQYSRLSQLELDVREVFYQASKRLKEPTVVTEKEKER